MAEIKSPVASRQAYLDHIRVFLTALVIMHHCAITYGSGGGWFYKEVSAGSLSPLTQLIYSLFATTNQAYFMGFFFLVAGYFTTPSLNRKGPGLFVRDRAIRLGIPLVVFALVLAPLTISLSRLTADGGTMFDGFYWVWVMHNYECGPMWFVQALLIFSLIYMVCAQFLPVSRAEHDESPLPSHLTLLVAALATGALAFGLRFILPVGQDVWGMQIGYFATYIVLFYVGCRAARSRWLERVELRHMLPWLGVSVLLIALLPVMGRTCPDGSLFTGGWNMYALSYAMWEPFVAWGIILGMLYVMRRFFSGTNPFMAGLARSSYAAFFLHAPVLVGLSVLAKPWVAEPMVKWLSVGSMACICSFALASLLVRLPGARKVM